MLSPSGTHLETLRATYPVFEYRSYSYQQTESGLELLFEFFISDEHYFKPRTLITGVTQQQLAQLSPQILNWYVFQIGLVEMLSYWKTTCSPQILVKAGELSVEEIAWWHKLLIKGLGEFFFVNQIEFTVPDFVKIISQNSPQPNKDNQSTQQDIKKLSNSNILISVGGGKDSAVTLSLLTAAGTGGLGTFHISPTFAAQDCARISGIPNQVFIRRELDPHLAEMNAQGFLNGHTPFSALVAFLSTFSAHLFNYSFVVLSNERSSNEGNVVFHDQEINHQYSKTFEFESDFQTYLQTYLAPLTDYPSYFSFLRPIYELQIGHLFAQFPEYHLIFRSCNRGRKTNSWCGECPKCLFAFLILSPFLTPAQMTRIFGQNLFAKPELLPIALELMGYGQQKPLECVGTHEESVVAAHLALLQYQSLGQPLPKLLELLYTQVLRQETNLNQRTSVLLQSWNSENSLPSEFETILRAALAKSTQS